MIYVIQCRDTGRLYRGFSDGWHVWVSSMDSATHYAVPSIYDDVADLQDMGYNVWAQVDTDRCRE